jgi:hypothetical protein
MTWVQRAVDKPPAHTCPLPRTVRGNPDGQFDDLWECDDCGRLWRIGQACDACELRGHPWPHSGQCRVGLEWRPASFWQRFVRHMHKARTA